MGLSWIIPPSSSLNITELEDLKILSKVKNEYAEKITKLTINFPNSANIFGEILIYLGKTFKKLN